jgi:hypothetical protein
MACWLGHNQRDGLWHTPRLPTTQSGPGVEKNDRIAFTVRIPIFLVVCIHGNKCHLSRIVEAGAQVAQTTI